MELAPKAPPTTAATESIKRTLLNAGRFPLSSNNFASSPTPITVPMVSKKSDMNSAKIIIIAATLTMPLLHMAPAISALKKVEKLAASGILTICVGRGIILKIIPTTVVPAIPMRMLPFTLKATSIMVSTSPKAASHV